MVPLVTTNYVLTEVMALLQHRLGLPWVRHLQTLMVPEFAVVWVDAGLHERAVSRLLSSDRRRLSLVDCASFEAMSELGLTQALSLDEHFIESGFLLYPTDVA